MSVHMNSVTLVIQVGGLIDVLLTLKEGSVGGAGELNVCSCGVDALPRYVYATVFESFCCSIYSTTQEIERTDLNDTSSFKHQE